MSPENNNQMVSLGLGSVNVNLDQKGKVIDYATGKTLKLLSKSPEESVRQWYEHILIDEYDYSPDQIDIEISVQMGSTTKKADIVVYENAKKNKKIVIIETKSPHKKEGVTQLQSYLESTGSEFGVWTNGDDLSYWYHGSPQSYEPVGRLIKSGETIDDIGATKLREELVPAKDLVSDFRAAEQFILAHQGGVDVFDEIFKIIFAKIFDEKKNLKTAQSEAHFRAGIKEPASKVKDRMKVLFEGAKALYSDVFSDGDEIKLNSEVTKWLVSLFQNYILSETDMDVLGVGFEILVNPKMKSDKGQYFTPRQVVRTAIEMLQVDENMKIVDPACGSGGFLIYSMERVWKNIENEWASPLDALAEKLNFAQKHIFGADYDERLARVAKAYMAIWGDGRAHIYSVPCSIKSYEWDGEVAEQIKDGTFDGLLTNPPFAGDLSLTNIAHNFDLGKKNGKELTKQRKDILFIERAIKLVRPSSLIAEKSGLIAIVLPKGDLDEREKSYVRKYILDNSMVLAVISLHSFSFVPFTSQKTSLVILKRMPKDNIPDDYDIFMAVSEKPGKDKSGNLVYVYDANGNIIDDEYGRAKVDTDLFDIAHEYVSKKPKLGYWVKKSQLVDRLNAEYYHPKYIAVRDMVTKRTYVKLGDLIKDSKAITNGIDLSSISNDGKRHYSDDGLAYLRVGDVKENEIDIEGAEKIDQSDYDLTRAPKLKTGDLLITRKGTTGRAAIVSDANEEKAILSSEIILVRLKKGYHHPDGIIFNIDPFYIAAYINSSYGKELILQKKTGGISQGINHPDLKEIEIPLLPQKEMDIISTQYRDANDKLKDSRKNIQDVSIRFKQLVEQ